MRLLNTQLRFLKSAHKLLLFELLNEQKIQIKPADHSFILLMIIRQKSVWFKCG